MSLFRGFLILFVLFVIFISALNFFTFVMFQWLLLALRLRNLELELSLAFTIDYFSITRIRLRGGIIIDRTARWLAMNLLTGTLMLDLALVTGASLHHAESIVQLAVGVRRKVDFRGGLRLFKSHMIAGTCLELAKLTRGGHHSGLDLCTVLRVNALLLRVLGLLLESLLRMLDLAHSLDLAGLDGLSDQSFSLGLQRVRDDVLLADQELLAIALDRIGDALILVGLRQFVLLLVILARNFRF